MADRVVSVALKAEIGQYVSGMARAAAATRGLGETTETSSRKAKAGYDLVGRGAVLMGAAVAGAVVGVAAKSMEFEKAMSAVAAATGKSGAALEDLRDTAMKAGADTQYSATEAAGAITEMAKAGVSAADIMGGGLSGALDLAAAGQLDVADAAGIASVAMTQFGLAGRDLPHVADLLAAGAGKAMGSVGDLGMALNQAGLVASQTGVSIEETTATLSAFASAGLIGSDAGTSFRSMLQHLQNPSKESAQKMAELGINMYDANGAFVGMTELAGQLSSKMGGLTQAQRDQAMAQIFGSDAVRAANVLYSEGAAGIAEWTAKVNDSGYAQRQAAQLTDNLSGDLERLGGAFDTLMIQLGSGGQGPLRELVQMLTAIVDVGGDVISFWNRLPGPVQAGIAAYAGFVAFRGPLTSMLTTLEVKGVLAASSLIDLATNADRARLGVARLVTAAAPLAAVVAAGYAVKNVVDFSNASDDARESVDGLRDSLEGLSKGQKLNALNDEIDKFQQQINDINNQNFFDKHVWVGFETDAQRIGKAREQIEALREEMARVESDAPSALDALHQFVSGITGAVQNTTAAVTESTEAQEKWLESLQQVASGFVDPLAAYQGLLTQKQEAERASAEATAASTASASDSWEDYVDDVDVSLGELAARLEQQITDQLNWRNNLAMIAQWAGADVAQHLAQMGQDGVDIVAKMADGTNAEAQRMAGLIRQDIQLGGMAWSADLDTAMKVMQEIGKQGAAATVFGVAAQLGMGAETVRSIAAQYGVNLAEGINPVLEAIGKAKVVVANAGKALSPGNFGWAEGGYTGDGGKYEPKGIVHGGEFVFTKEQTTKAGLGNLYAYAKSLDGYARGGFVTAADVPRPYSTAPYRPPISTAGDSTMQLGFDQVRAWMEANAPSVFGGVAGAGAVGGAWQSLWQLVKSQIPQARINSTFRAGDPGYHGRGKAIDFGFGAGPGGAGSAGLASINRLLHDQVGRNLAELIYDGIGDDRPDLKNGRPLTYNAGTRAAHRHHVHAAVYDSGGPLYPGYTLAYNGTGQTEWVSREFGGGGGSQPVVKVVAPSMEGMRISGVMDLGGGLEGRIDGRIEHVVFGGLSDEMSARGVHAP